LTEHRQQYDVVVSGGGMVGAALGCALAQQGFDIAVLDPRPPQKQWPADDISNRVSALTRVSQHVFENLGCWQRILELGAAAYDQMHVWDRRGIGEIHFDAASVGEPDLGHIAENRSIRLALWEQLERLPGVTIHCPATIRSLQHGDTGSTVALDDGRELTAALVVAADGARSPLRGLAGIGVTVRSFEQLAVVATVRTDRGHARTAWQRFLPTGPLAFLPVDAKDRCSIVWSTTPEQAQELLDLDDSGFCRALGEAGEYRVGAILETGPRASFPLRSQIADQTVAPGLALVGDAAHVIHPLAGQGVNLGLLDAASLAAVLGEAREQRRPLGDYATLRRHERARKGDTLLVMRAMEGFDLLFSNRSTPLSMLRNAGLRLTDAAGPVKRLLMRRALDGASELPPLARPFFQPY
jgi:2-octaprenylphenol hydroxylase